MLVKLMPGILLTFVSVAMVVLVSDISLAETLQSSNYKFDESSIGNGSMIQSSSSNFKISGATSDLAVGNSLSENYQIDVGSQTTSDPTLTFIVNESENDFGMFSATTPAMTTASFSVINYTSYGYVAQIFGSAPEYGGHTISAMSETASSQVGIDQFGMNLVANTTPQTIGANPDNGQFGFGEVATNYATTNQYRFVSGETIAYAPKSSGKTTYTISYLVNVTPLAPGGTYTSNLTIIVTGTY